MTHKAFVERLRHRKKRWWLEPDPGIHPVGECNALLERDAPEARWRCCPVWQRKLSNKWNAREFAQRHDCRVPALYWHGRNVAEIPFADLPRDYAVRSTSGFAAQNVLVMSDGTNLLDRRRYGCEELRLRIGEFLERGYSQTRILIEEFARSEDGESGIPVDYKFHMFGDTIAAVMVVEPGDTRRETDVARDYYSADWERIPLHMLDDARSGGERLPPVCWDEMKQVAMRLGSAYETYVRVDLYATDEGCVFGEFSPTPGFAPVITSEGDAYFERFCRTIFPEGI